MKRNHWVPQSYLRHFAADPPVNSKIWRLSKSSGSPELKPIKKVAVKHHLYTPLVCGKRDFSFEKKLADLEQLFGSEYWKAISAGLVDLTGESIRKGVGLIATVTFLRNPQQFALTQRVHSWLVNMLTPVEGQSASLEIGNRFGSKSIALDWSNWINFKNSNDEEIKTQWLTLVGGATSLAESLVKMRWAIVIADKPFFVTSDNPVSLLHPSLGFRGFKDDDSTVIFPLGPTRLLVMDNRHAEPDGQYYQLNPKAPWNAMIWRNAIDFMFSPRCPDEVCLEIEGQSSELGC